MSALRWIVIAVIGISLINAKESDEQFSRQDRDYRPLQFGKRDDFRPLQFGKKDSYRPLQFGKRSAYRPLQFGKRSPFDSFRLTDPRVPSVRQWQFIYPQMDN